MQHINFQYDEHNFNLVINAYDTSGRGAILEIITRNDYKLNNYKNQKGKIFVDIGANLGIATIIMAKLNPESLVYAFEPCSKVFDLLIENIRINNLKNVIVFNKAVTKKGISVLKLSINNTMTGASSTYADSKFFEEYKNNSFENVNCVSFDEFIKENNISKIHLLKIDCEGAEYDIIYDSEYFKNSVVENITGEFHDLYYNNVQSNNGAELIEYCKKYVNGSLNISILKV